MVVMDYQGSRERMKNTKSIFRKLIDLFTIEKATDIPEWMIARKKGDDISKANAALKIIKFGGEVKLTQNKLRELYEIEEEYEIVKIKAQREFPHIPEEMRKLISEARQAKMIKMKKVLIKYQFDIYSKIFRKRRQHY